MEYVSFSLTPSDNKVQYSLTLWISLEPCAAGGLSHRQQYNVDLHPPNLFPGAYLQSRQQEENEYNHYRRLSAVLPRTTETKPMEYHSSISDVKFSHSCLYSSTLSDYQAYSFTHCITFPWFQIPQDIYGLLPFLTPHHTMPCLPFKWAFI